MKALTNHSHHTFFLLWIKCIKVGHTRNISFEKNNVASLYTKRFVFFPLNNNPDVAWHISKRY